MTHILKVVPQLKGWQLWRSSALYTENPSFSPLELLFRKNQILRNVNNLPESHYPADNTNLDRLMVQISIWQPHVFCAAYVFVAIHFLLNVLDIFIQRKETVCPRKYCWGKEPSDNKLCWQYKQHYSQRDDRCKKPKQNLQMQEQTCLTI